MWVRTGILIVAALSAVSLSAQQSPDSRNQTQGAPIISINIERTIQTVDYRTKGSTKIDFRGTALLPRAEGEAKIDPRNGSIEIEAKFGELPPASQFGNAYLTYVLWAITPEGRASNLGEVIAQGGKSKLNVTTRLQNFGLIVTAEPFSAVTAPSEDVVLENLVRPDTKGQVEAVNAKYELLQRGRYRDANLQPLVGNVPLSLLEARNAKRIAQWRKADQYAPDAWARAIDTLDQAEAYEKRKQTSGVNTTARDASQAFEDAITVAAKREEDDRQTAERQAAADREAQAKAAQEAEEQQRLQADQQRLQAERDAATAAAAQAKAQQAQAEAQQAQAEADRQRLEAQQQQQQAQEAAAAAQANAAAAQDAAAKAQQEQQDLRAALLKQFSLVLETRDTARGLIVNLGDVLFATGKSDLRPEARERLAKLSGIVLAHPGLNLAVEGYTDNVGSAAYNQTLSQQRAAGVQSYLVGQGLPQNAVTAQGFGMDNPVADNSTPQGRQQNRRVEIVVSGEIIGTKIESLHTQP